MKQQQSTASKIAGQVRPSVWNTPVNCKGGHKHVADFHKFSALVVHFVQKLQLFLATKSMPVVFHTPHLPHSATCNIV